MVAFFFAFFFIWIPCGFFAAVVAGDKGHGGVAWFLGGVIFGPMALIAAAGLGDRKLRRYQRFQAEAQGWQEKPTVTFEQKLIGEKRPRDPATPRSFMDKLDDAMDPDRNS